MEGKRDGGGGTGLDFISPLAPRLDPNKEAYRVENNLYSEVPFLATKFSDGTDGPARRFFCFYERPI